MPAIEPMVYERKSPLILLLPPLVVAVVAMMVVVRLHSSSAHLCPPATPQDQYLPQPNLRQ